MPEWEEFDWNQLIQEQVMPVPHSHEKKFDHDWAAQLLRQLMRANELATMKLSSNRENFRQAGFWPSGADYEEVENFYALARSVTPEKFVLMVTLLGPEDEVNFYKALTVRLCLPDSRKEDKSMFKAIRDQKVDYSVSTATGQSKPTDACLRRLHEQRPEEGQWAKLRKAFFDGMEKVMSFSMLNEATGKKEIHFSYCSAGKLFSDANEGDKKSCAYVLAALADSRHAAFDTVLVNGLVTHAWSWLKYDFYFERFADLALIAMFVGCSFDIRNEKRPRIYLCLLMIAVCLRNLYVQVGMLIGSTMMYKIRGIAKHLAHWGLIVTITEMWVIIVSLWLCVSNIHEWLASSRDKCTAEDEDCAFVRHPVHFAVAVIVKWLHFSVSMLCTQTLGESVLPAFHAVTSMNSLRFLGFLLVVWMGTMNAYYVFPIDENTGDSNHVLNMFMKIFRLEFLGDFDLWELEGINPVLNIHMGPNGTSDMRGVIDDGNPEGLYHKGVIGLFVGVSIFFTIMFLNVYIGLLSDEYTSAKRTARNYTLKLKALLMVEMLHLRVIWQGCCSCCAEDEVPIKDGVWIGYDPTFVVSTEVDITEKVDDLSKSLSRKIAEMHNGMQHVIEVSKASSTSTVTEMSKKVDRMATTIEKLNSTIEQVAKIEKSMELLRGSADKVEKLENEMVRIRRHFESSR